MPFYDYLCTECNEEFTIFHEISEEKTDCEKCGSKKTLEKLISTFNTNIKQEKENHLKPGDKTKKFIEEARKELKEEREKMRKQSYGDR